MKWVFDSGKRGKDRDGNPVIQSLIMDINHSEQMNMMYRQERRQYRDAITHDCEYSFSVDLTSGYLGHLSGNPRPFNDRDESAILL